MSLKLLDGMRLPYRMSALLKKDSKDREATNQEDQRSIFNLATP